MGNHDTTTNYHNSLTSLSRNFDQMVELFQKQKSEGKLEQSWRFRLMATPLKDMKSAKGASKIKAIVQFSSPIIAVPGIATYLMSLWTNFPYWFVGVGIIIFILTYYFTAVIIYQPKMLDATNERMFHLAAYRDKRPNEYALFSRVFIYNDFSFSGLENYVNTVLSKQDDDSQMVRELKSTFESEVSYYKDQVVRQEESYKEAMDELENILLESDEELRKREDIQAYLIYFINNINVLLYRLTNNKLSLSDLSFLAGFTIYEKREDKLVKVPNGDHGTTGASLDEISLTDERYKDYSSVLVAKKEDIASRYQEVRENYYIVSYRMKLDIKGEKIWIFNFHVNKNSNDRAWNLLLNDGIMNTEETYRLFHAFCLIIYNHNYGAEGINDATN